ncbi:MAG: hypothetical protein M1831_007209 [Alyxoria varia]|nr:MAG: hypothetical protein M1831_007209 [Alyxoria varia]
MLGIILLVTGLSLLCNFSSYASASVQHREQKVLDRNEVESTRPNESLFELHKRLVQFESVTGNEGNIGLFLLSYLKGQNFTVQTHYVPAEKSSSKPLKPPPDLGHGDTGAPENGNNGAHHTEIRFNLYAQYGTVNTGQAPRVLLSSHIDTVPPFFPYRTRRNSTTNELEIWGRGSADDKASVAAQIKALEELKEEGKIADGDVALLFVVGEETGGDGMKQAAKGFSDHLDTAWDAVIFGEPTSSHLVSGHKGILMFEIHAFGRTAHSGYPWLGVSANSILVRALSALETLAITPGGLPWSSKFGNSTLNVGRIDGGVASNVVAEKAMASIAIRIADGGPSVVKNIVEKEVKRATDDLIEERGGSIEFEYSSNGYAPVNLDTDISDGDDAFFGDPITVNFGTDVPNLELKDTKMNSFKRYLYGPGAILVAHSDHEYVEAKELQRAVEGYKRLIIANLEKK